VTFFETRWRARRSLPSLIQRPAESPRAREQIMDRERGRRAGFEIADEEAEGNPGAGDATFRPTSHSRSHGCTVAPSAPAIVARRDGRTPA
jgi:hypothetical protein